MNHEEYVQAANYWVSKEDSIKAMPREELVAAVESYLKSKDTCALATGYGDFIRCTPIEYVYGAGAFWFFTEGGLKFKGLEKNKNVSIAIFDDFAGFNKLQSVQVMGVAEVVAIDSEDFTTALNLKHIPEARRARVEKMLHVLKVKPITMEIINSQFTAQGYSGKQKLQF